VEGHARELRLLAVRVPGHRGRAPECHGATDHADAPLAARAPGNAGPIRRKGALYAFWRPRTLHATTEAELRALKVGYRATSLKRIAESFVRGTIDERAIRSADRETARRELLELYGIGAASVSYLLFEVFHHYDAFDTISPWEQKIYSRLLFGRETVPANRILSEVKRRWGAWRMLASHYVFEDLFWRHRQRPLPWLDGLIRS
jgi:3-methyladenine DNA glycosylase/8-oxoguanine DNA glycosylase